MSWRPQIDDDIYLDKTGSSGSVSIPEYTSDPASPSPQDTWVLRTGSTVGGGSPIGLLLALTKAGTGSYSYQLRYRTLESTTVGVALS